jgi:outer membrane protein
MIKQLLSVFLFFSIAIASVAQSQSGKKIYTLKECIEIALQNNLTVKRSELGLKNADITLDQSRYTMLPTLNLSGSGGLNFGRSVDPTTNQFIDQQINNANVSVNASLLLFNAFRVMNGIRQSVNDKAASEKDLTKAKNDVILSVITLYTSVIFNQELFQNAQFQLKTTQQQLERTKKLEQAGSVPLGNVLDLEAQNATNELNLIQRENAYNLSLLQLKQSLQLPASTPLDIEVPALTVEDQVLDQTTEQIYDIARQNLPEIKAALFRTESANYGLKSARGNLYPRLSLNGSTFTNYSSASEIVYGSFSNQISNNISKSLSLNLTIPIFNGYSTRSTVLRSKVTKEQAYINMIDVENRLRQAIETAYNDASAAAKTYASSAKAVKAREEAFRMTKQRYDAGASNYVDYQVSENNLFQAKSDQVRAKYDLIFKKKVLDFYQGKPIDY